VEKEMKKEDLLKLGLDETSATKVAEASTEELKGYIPKARFDEVNDANKQFKTDLAERNTQFEELKKTAGASEDLKKQITDLQAANKTKETEYEGKIKQMQINAALEKDLSKVGITGDVKIKAVKALLDLEKAELDGDSIKGLGDQLKKLQEGEDSKFLFGGSSNNNQGQFKGMKPGVSGEPKTSLDDLNTQYQEALKSGNTAKTIMLKNKIFEEQNKK
jgi:hypothetical protein